MYSTARGRRASAQTQREREEREGIEREEREGIEREGGRSKEARMEKKGRKQLLQCMEQDEENKEI